MSILEDKVYLTGRSLFRLLELQEMNSPDILIEAEKNILTKRLSELTMEESIILITKWQEFYEKEKVENEIDSERIIRLVEKEIEDLN